MKKNTGIEIDGAMGEGGGQILRTALSLSMITGKPFSIVGIRAGRAKPGLLRQHLTAVQAAEQICGARVEGAHVGSLALSFAPGSVRSGTYSFAIGTAGSCTLVLQTILPALWFADGASEVYVRGGTHNKAAPPADFLIRAWAPLVASMGVLQELVLERHGFYPAGGGQMSAYVRPIRALHKLSLNDRGALRAMRAIAVYADLPRSIGEREVARAANAWPTIVQEVHEVHRATCPGNAFFVQLDHESVSEVFCGFGEVGIRAESVADHSIGAAQSYLASDAAVGGYLADQLLLPMAIAGSGEFTTTHASSHLRTNIAVIEKFLALEISVEEAHTRVRVRIQR